MALIHDVNELKTQAKNLRKALSHTGTEITHAQALELVAQSALRGPAKQLAAHAAFVSHADGVLRLSLAPEQEHLKSPSLVLQLGDAVASLLGGNVQLRLDVGAAPGETANARQSRERTLRQGQAERGFAEEPAIRRLVETRGAQIVPDSIRPLGDN